MATNPFLGAGNRIRTDADEVFGAVMEHVREQYLRRNNEDLAQVKIRIMSHCATVLPQKEVLLRDTLFNHLTADAITALGGADVATMNRFYKSNRAWIETAKKGDRSQALEPVRFSPDRRFAYSAGAGLLAGGGARWLVVRTVTASLQGPLVLGSIAIAALLTFQAASHQGLHTIESEVQWYLNSCKSNTLAALDDVINRYRTDFATFVDGISGSTP